MSEQDERFETEEKKDEDEVEAHRAGGHRGPQKNDEGTDDDSSEDFEAHRAGGHRGPV